MTPIQYDPQLVETAVNLAVRKDSTAERELRRSLEPLYAQGRLDERDAPFQDAHAQWFIRLGLDSVISGWLDEFPRIRASVHGIIVRSAARSKQQMVELFVRDVDKHDAARRTLIIHICPESLCSPPQARDIFLRELMHVADMLDPQFAYEPLVIGGTPARQQLVKDRYRVLWDIQVEKRLTAGGRLEKSSIGKFRALLDRVFSNQGDTEELFQSIWHAEQVTHRELLAWAESAYAPTKVLESAGAMAACSNSPGAACALCGSSTFEWADPADTAFQIAIKRLAAMKPDWSAASGLCQRCVEVLASRRREEASEPNTSCA